MAQYQTFELAVEGGRLHGGVWGRGGPVVLAAHGITANHMEFEALADQLGEGVRLIAPDLRGRGRSNGIRGEWSMQAHARDLMAVLEHFAIPRADLLLGHSMGGFVAAVTAADYAPWIRAVLLVDGGLPVLDRIPWFLPAGLLIRKLIGPAMQRLDMRFASAQAYRDFWRAHPALATEWSGYVERYVDYDLVGEPPGLRSSVFKDAILGDTRSMMGDDGLALALQRMQQPVRLLRAPRGLFNGKPLYKPALVEKWKRRMPNLRAEDVADVNHYSILIGERGARAAAAVVREMVAA